jgi:hypothetical protein
MPVFKIQHNTHYEYDRLIQESMNEIRIFPVHSAEQEVLEHELLISGNPEVQIFLTTGATKQAYLMYCRHTENSVLTVVLL